MAYNTVATAREATRCDNTYAAGSRCDAARKESNHRKRVRGRVGARRGTGRAYLLVARARTACGVRAPLRLN